MISQLEKKKFKKQKHHHYNIGLITIIAIIAATIYVVAKYIIDISFHKEPKAVFAEDSLHDVSFTVKVDGANTRHSGAGKKMIDHGQVISIE